MPNEIKDNGALLSRILSLACPSTDFDADGWAEYQIETHCVVITMQARVNGRIMSPDGEYDYSTFEIRSVTYD